MNLLYKAGTVNVTVNILILDSVSGARETGVDSVTAGLALWYMREGGLKVVLSGVNDLSSLDDPHNDGGILHISDGLYRLDLPDAAIADGAGNVTIGGGATGMVVLAPNIQLVQYDPQDQDGLGLTNLDTLVSELATVASAQAESYHTKGDPATLAQLNWAIYSILTSAQKVGNLMTVRQQDGSPAMTLTLNDPSLPTDVVRST